MAVNLPTPDILHPVAGALMATGRAGIKKSATRDDLCLIALAPGSSVAGVFTQSSFKAAPVLVAQSHLQQWQGQDLRALLINSGNANAATGELGLTDARETCAWVAQALDIEATQVLPFSTGVIGERLPLDRMAPTVRTLSQSLQSDGWLSCARAIMTTDTGPKAVSRQIELDGRTLTFTGMAKGAGMIRPDMATMLAYIVTDASVAPDVLTQMLQHATARSFNRITIDGDTSTNDAFVIAATGAAGAPRIDGPQSPGYDEVCTALTDIARTLAQYIVRDGEGATRFIEVCVEGGRNETECLQVAYTIAESPLVKTAAFAGDPNWGRFCMAIGRSGIADLDTTGVSLWLDDVCVARGGLLADSYREEDGARVMGQPEFQVRVDLGRGSAVERVWTSDFSYEYVRINAEYRT